MAQKNFSSKKLWVGIYLMASMPAQGPGLLVRSTHYETLELASTLYLLREAIY